MNILDNQSVLYEQAAGSCGTATDVVWVRDDGLAVDVDGDGDLDAVRGRAVCAVWTSLWGVCDQNWTIYNRLEIYFNTLTRMPGAINAAIADNYDLNVRKTLGHELGHTVGLSHNSGAASATCSSSTASGSDDSMRSG